VKSEADFQKLLEKIGERLAELRKKKGYTSHETFAYDHEMSRVQYWRIEKGRTNLTLKSLVNLLKIHGLSLKEFFNSLP
jgi:transcriptional regulator with XRE-family HTH domain